MCRHTAAVCVCQFFRGNASIIQESFVGLPQRGWQFVPNRSNNVLGCVSYGSSGGVDS